MARRWAARAMALGLAAASILTQVGQPSAKAQGYTWDHVSIGGGGYITGLTFQPGVPGLVYARSDTAGLFRWDSSAQKWTNLTHWMSVDWRGTRSSLSIAVDPNPGTDTTRQGTIYATFSGGFNGTFQVTAEGAGLYRSTNRGDTWSRIWEGARTTVNGDVVVAWGGNAGSRATGEGMAVDPNNPDVLYVATGNDGLYRSLNARSATPTFSKLTAPTGFVNDSYNPRGINAVLIDSRAGTVNGRTSTIYLSIPTSRTDQQPNFDGGIWRSTDGGENWTKLTSGTPPKLACRMALGPNNSIIVAERRQTQQGSGHDDNYPVLSGGLYKYTPSANAWTKLPGTADIGFENIAIDPADTNRIVASGSDGNLWRATDGAATAASWTKKRWSSYKNTASDNDGIYFDDVGWMVPGFQYPLGADAEFDPNNPGDVWFCDAFGVHRTDDVWAASIRFEPRLKGLETTVPFALDAPPTGSTLLYASAADVNGWQISDLTLFPTQQMAQTIFAASGDTATQGDAVVSDISHAPSATQNVAVVRTTNGGYYNENRQVYVSKDNGVTWARRPLPALDLSTGYGFGPAKIAISSTDPNRAVFMGPYNYPKYTTNLFDTTSSIAWNGSSGVDFYSTDTWVYSNSGTRLAADAKDGNTFYFTRSVNETLEIWRSTTGGASWSRSSTVAQASWPWGNSTMMHPMKNTVTDTGEVWVGVSRNGLHRSTTGGTSFSAIPKVTVCLGFAFGKASSTSSYPTLFVAGKVKVDGVTEKEGVFLSIDLGQTFAQITTDGTPIVGGMGGLNDMVGDQRTFGRVYITLPGHGVVYSTDNSAISTVATPTFSPAGGTYTSTQSVQLSTTTADATIRYTTNGTDVTSFSTAYSGAISVSATTTIKAKAFKSGMSDSSQASATYTISTSEGPAGYTFAANEGGSYTITGTADLAYGANGSFNYLASRTGTVTFNNATFGDPIPGVFKKGYYKTVTATPTSGKLTGTVIGTSGSWSNSGNDRDKVFDGNLTTFFDAPDANANNAWVGLDLGVAKTFSTIKYAPRPGQAARMVGGKFQASNAADFSSGVVDLPTIGTAPVEGSLTSISVNPGEAYRYVRYLAPSGGYGNIAEMEVWGASALPSPWVAGDIGTAANQAGSSSYESGTSTWTVEGGGDDIWGTSDKFRYVYQDTSGDCEIEARVNGLENTNEWAKAGVMIRESTAADSRFVMVIQRPDNQIGMQWRTATAGSAAWNGTLLGTTTSAKYVRVTRVGNKFRGYYKVNAADSWTEISTGQSGGGIDAVMASATKAGLAVTAHTGTNDTVANLIATATVGSVTATP